MNKNDKRYIKRALILLLTAILCLSSVSCGKAKKEAQKQALIDAKSTLDNYFENKFAPKVPEVILPDTDLTAEELSPKKDLPDPPDIDINDWRYVLANADNPLPEGYAPEDIEYVGEQDCPIDARIAENLADFAYDCMDAGYPVYLSSGYRSYEYQEELYWAKVEEYGEEEAASIVLPPGTSEHQTGLCCDITDEYRSPKNPDELSQTETFKWLNAHCTEYGFILRYPENKNEITKVIYEPWHFRYVGKEVAEYITENDLCLEEFVELYK